MPKLYVAALFALCSLCLSAHADRSFTLLNGTFSTAASGGTAVGTLSGLFSTNDAMTAVIGYSFYTSATGDFSGYHYILSNSSVTASSLPSQYFRIDNASSTYELQFYFANGLSASGGTLLTTNSYESEPRGGNRFLSGTVTPTSGAATTAVTPEPSSIFLLGTGLLGIAGAMKRRLQ